MTNKEFNYCPDCGEVKEDSTTSYECGNCGEEFTLEDEGTHRCPSCGKFAAKVSDNACPDCGTDLEETPEDYKEEG